MAFHTGTATNYLTLLDALVTFATTDHVATAGVGAAGTGYVAGDVLTASGGTFNYAATFEVLTIGGGGTVTSVRLVESGSYTATPGSPVATTGGTGTGCTIAATFTGIVWTIERNLAPGEKEVILNGVGSGTDAIYVGIRTFNGGTYFNWELAGFTGYDNALPWSSQPGISPGRFDAVNQVDREGAYVPLNNSSIQYWLSVTGRRILGVFKMGSTYTNLYLGFLNQFGTSNEYPYPLLVGGCTSEETLPFNNSGGGFSGMVDPFSFDGHNNGPFFLWQPGGGWLSWRNGEGNGASTTPTRIRVVSPTRSIIYSNVVAEDQFLNTGGEEWDDVAGSATTRDLEQTPNSGGDLSQLIRPLLISTDPTPMLAGEMDGVFWLSTTTSGTVLVPEDTVVQSPKVYRVFKNCNRTTRVSHFAMEEA